MLALICHPRAQDAADVNLTEEEVEKIAHDIEVKLFNVHNQVRSLLRGQLLVHAVIIHSSRMSRRSQASIEVNVAVFSSISRMQRTP